MSTTEKPFTKRQIQIIVKIAFLEAMLIVFVIPNIQSSGEIPTAPCAAPCLTLIQRGNVTVTVLSGSANAFTTVTYPTPFTGFPSLSITPTIPPAQTSNTIITTSHLSFLSGITTVWTSFPPGTNEIFNDANHEHMITVNWLSPASTFRFGVLCIAPSSTAGTYLTIQYSIDAGVTWTEVDSATRYTIDNTNCILNSAQFFGSGTIPTVAKTANTRLRVVGVGGSGLGDNPSFSQLWVEWSNSFTSIITGSWRACPTLALCNSPNDTGKTSFIIQVTYGIVLTSTQTWKFVWTAGLPQ